MTWDFAETNPFADSSGAIIGAAEYVAKVVEGLPAACVGSATQADAAGQIGAELEIISTDPPYYDNIGYADLSDFFYVWLRRNLQKIYPEETRTLLVPKDAELVATPYRHGGREKAEAFFLEGMTRALAELARRSVPNVPTTIYYAFKQSEESEAAGTAALPGISSTGWQTFLDAVSRAGFGIVGTWPVRTERAGRSIEIGTNALASSVVLVCRKRPADAPTITRAEFRRILRADLPAALKALQHGHIAPVDLAQACIGPGMAVFSRHAKVLEADGTAMSVRTALQLINEALDEYLSAQEGESDGDTRFAVTWFESRGFEPGPYGEAETLAKARNVSVSALAEDGMLKSAAGKVRLCKRAELRDAWDPRRDTRLTVWESVQHLIKRMESAGEPAAAALLQALGSTADKARDLAYRLYSVCERKGWAEEARAYNGLVIAWPELQKIAAGSAPPSPIEPAQAELFGHAPDSAAKKSKRPRRKAGGRDGK
jgi:putative DNA methylase